MNNVQDKMTAMRDKQLTEFFGAISMEPITPEVMELLIEDQQDTYIVLDIMSEGILGRGITAPMLSLELAKLLGSVMASGFMEGQDEDELPPALTLEKFKALICKIVCEHVDMVMAQSELDDLAGSDSSDSDSEDSYPVAQRSRGVH